MQGAAHPPGLNVQVTHLGERADKGALPCVVGKHIKFDDIALRSYRASGWTPLCHDVMLVAAAVEACDHSLTRLAGGWGRKFAVTVPVHDPKLWNRLGTRKALARTLGMLTGDIWAFRFTKTKSPLQDPAPDEAQCPAPAGGVILLNGGLDSLAVSTVMGQADGSRVVRVRVGGKKAASAQPCETGRAFMGSPFHTSHLKSGGGESSGRSRGFKRAALGGLAAFLAGSDRVIMPESGQTALGPTLISPAWSYPDRRAHPQFTVLMSGFLEALFGRAIKFEHPSLWKTKGEIIAEHRALASGDEIWRETRSCQAEGGRAALDGEPRQCGVCPACMLRRSSLHAAGYSEDSSLYTWGDLSARDFWAATRQNWASRSRSQRDHAVAGVLSVDHLAGLPLTAEGNVSVLRQALALARALGIDFGDALSRIKRMLEAHAGEWRSFVRSLPRESFVRGWATGGERVITHILGDGRGEGHHPYSGRG